MALSLVLSGLAVLLSIISLAAVYDRIIRKAICHLYDPHIDLTLQQAGDDTTKQFHVEKGKGHIPTYHDEFEIPYYKLPESDPTVERFSPDKNIETRMFSFSVHGQDTKKATVQLRLTTRGVATLRFETHRMNDPTDPIKITRDGPDTVYQFSPGTISNVDPYWSQANFEMQMNEGGTYRSFRITGELDVEIDASEFVIPVIGWHFPKNIGAIEYEPIRREWTILGPDHPDIDPKVVNQFDSLDTKKIEPEQRDWVATKNGAVVSKFSVESTTEIPTSCEVEYVDDLNAVERDPTVLTEAEQHFFGVYQKEA